MVIQLVEHDGCLYIPFSAIVDKDQAEWMDGEDAMLIYYYPEGDCDTIEWNGYSQGEDWEDKLTSALVDAIEIGLIPYNNFSVLLPDNSRFLIG